MIDKSKTYRTRDGREVRIYATDGEELEPIHGAVKKSYGWHSFSWPTTGLHNQYSDFDLIEVRPRHKRTVWVNVYPHNMTTYDTKKDADKSADDANRLACLRVELDFEDGEGL